MTANMPMAALVGTALFACGYFLPALAAFLRAHRRFFLILALNLAVAPVQAFLFHALAPGLFVLAGASPLTVVGHALLVFLGPGWLATLLWSLAPAGAPDARLVAARRTKLFDFFAAVPLILWFAYGVVELRPILVLEAQLIFTGKASLFVAVQFFALSASALFNLLTIWLLAARSVPVRKSQGWLPRLWGFIGTFLGVGILHLPVARLGLPLQIVSGLLVGAGSLMSVLVLWRLGKSFSIMPEARVLVTSGPYAYARHPLYAVEIITILGSALQFRQPWALLLAAGVTAMQVIRSLFEEQVLTSAYPEYAAYRAKTARFIPGII
jgi:protein-S-isoprenylcysteine O-methyltransferase Ste14